MVDTRDSKSCAERRGGSSPLQGKSNVVNTIFFDIEMSGFFCVLKDSTDLYYRLYIIY